MGLPRLSADDEWYGFLDKHFGETRGVDFDYIFYRFEDILFKLKIVEYEGK